MAREYTRVHEFHLPLHELQPGSHHYLHYELQQAAESAPSAFELTVGGSGGVRGACAGASALIIHAPLQSHTLVPPQVARKGKPTRYSSESFDLTGCETALPAPSVAPAPPNANTSRKRKPSSYGTGSAYDDDGEDSRSTRTAPDKKQNHSEIEKRRRDKMNTYITELSAIVPMCGAIARKLDKLTVLRMAVQHMRSVRGALSACPLTARPRPAFLSERERNALILDAAHDCFLLVVGCDRGRLLYVSASVKRMLLYDQSELLGQSLFDILHPKDVAKVKEQLSSSDLSPRERLIDAKTMLPVKAEVTAGASRLCPGARRSFFCRIKCKVPPEAAEPPIKQEAEPAAKLRKKQLSDKKYCVVQCTGYLKSWTPVEMSEGTSGGEGGEEGEGCSLSCLVAVGRALADLAPEQALEPTAPATLPTRRLQYVSRHALDGKFLFVDHRVTLALGFLPQELLGTSLYEYTEGPELGAVARAHKTALLHLDPLHTPPYSFRRKDGALARIQTHFKPFKNPWTKDVECLVANNTVLAEGQAPAADHAADHAFDIFKQTEMDVCQAGAGDEEAGGVSEADVEMQRLIESQVESHKIGSAIAEEALRRANAGFSPDLPVDLLQDTVFNQQWLLKANVVCEQASLVDNIMGSELSETGAETAAEVGAEACAEAEADAEAGFAPVRNNVPLSSAAAGSPPPAAAAGADSSPPVSPLAPLGLDGNGEAAMAVIMSLLEADAGLGGPVNFSGLPWPLP